MTLSTLATLASPSAPSLPSKRASAIYLNLCNILQTLLLLHRPSLGGRLHLVIPVLQRLMALLFTPHSKGLRTAGRTEHFLHPSWLEAKQHPLALKHAQKFARLLTLLCNPPQSAVSGHRQHHVDLVDETRKARIHVGQFGQYLLHRFCVLVLNGRLGEGMRDALTPGIWAVVDVMEMDREGPAGGKDEGVRGVKALGAAMGNAERAVLRSVWEDWRKFGAWKGG